MLKEEGDAGLVAGLRFLVTGVLSDRSIAFAVGERLAQGNATIVLTSPPQTMRRAERLARRFDGVEAVLPLDVTDPDDVSAVIADVRGRGPLHGALHAVAYAPPSCLGGNMTDAPWEDVATTLNISAYSLSVVARIVQELAPPSGASIVGLDFDARLAWPGYNWMGVAKAALESLTRYLALQLGPSGIRVNLVAAGPIRSLAARGIPGFHMLERAWSAAAPLGWDPDDRRPIANACLALLSDLLRTTTGEIVHVDGGAHATALGAQLSQFFTDEGGLVETGPDDAE